VATVRRQPLILRIGWSLLIKSKNWARDAAKIKDEGRDPSSFHQLFDGMLEERRGRQLTWESSPIRELNEGARAATPRRTPEGRHHHHLPTATQATRSPAGGGSGSLAGPCRAHTASIKPGARARRRRRRGGGGGEGSASLSSPPVVSACLSMASTDQVE
jgi:hypothetical protein